MEQCLEDLSVGTLHDGDRALELVEQLLTDAIGTGGGGIYPNLLCACPPFQIDGNFGYIAGVNEMLVTTEEDRIILLPALPSRWKNGNIRGLRINGKTIDMEWKDGKLISQRICD